MASRTQIQQPQYDKDYPPRASLLGIPGELRNSIYQLLFPGPEAKTKDTTILNALLISRQVYHEAAMLAFKSHRFVIHAKGSTLADKLNMLSDEQKGLIQTIERPGLLRRGLHFYLAIEKHLRPSCLITETNDALNLLSGIVRIESLAQIFLYSSFGDSMSRLCRINQEMRSHDLRHTDTVKEILDLQAPYRASQVPAVNEYRGTEIVTILSCAPNRIVTVKNFEPANIIPILT